MPRKLMRDEVTRALMAVGGNQRIPFEVTDVRIFGEKIHILVRLNYRKATPVCCGEPGCTVFFLGTQSVDVPHALTSHLRLAFVPSVSMSVSLCFEAGYEHLSLPTAFHSDQVVEYGHEHFSGLVAP